MFIRESTTKNKKTKAIYKTLKLVENYHTEKGSRQRVIMSLGTIDLSRKRRRELATLLEARISGQQSFLEEDKEIAVIADEALRHNHFVKEQRNEIIVNDENADMQLVDLNSASSSFYRSLGAELIAHTFLEKLDFDSILKNCGFNPKQLSIAKAVILGRLIQPHSEIGTWRWFQQNLTNTYFEGSANGNKRAKNGHSKEKRTDCPLVTLALVVDKLGFLVFSQIYDGNQSEPETLGDVLEKLKKDAVNFMSDTKPVLIIGERIGKIKAKYPTIGKYYEIEAKLSDDEKKVIEITWTKKPQREQRSIFTGRYVIETTQTDLSAKDIWKQYLQLTRVESAFQDLKSELGLRPVYHQTADRTEAHLFIGVLAYHLLVSIEHVFKSNGDNREWNTIKTVLSTHQRSTIIFKGRF